MQTRAATLLGALDANSENCTLADLTQLLNDVASLRPAAPVQRGASLALTRTVGS